MNTIILCNVPNLDINHNHSFTFKNLNHQNDYFLNKRVLVFDDTKYHRVGNSIKIPLPFDDERLIRCNYLLVKNHNQISYGKTYFYFITNKEYVNSETTKITLKLDVIQTYLFDIRFGQCYIERQHYNPYDSNGDLNIDILDRAENLEVGEYIVEKIETIYDYKNKGGYIVASSSKLSKPTTTGGGSVGTDSGTSSALGRKIVESARKLIGKDYVWGGNYPPLGNDVGTDCSGLMQWAYNDNGITISRTTYSQIHEGKEVGVNELMQGDLIFTNWSDPSTPEHVFMYSGKVNENLMCIEAPQQGEQIRERVFTWGSDTRARRIISNSSAETTPQPNNPDWENFPSNVKEFINTVYAGANDGFHKYGLFASVTIAQGGHETGWNTKPVGNNLFGIKADRSWTGKTVTVETWEDYGNGPVTITDTFRAYDTIYDSIIDRCKFLQENSNYVNAGVFSATTPQAQCQALKNAGYATDPAYVEKLMRIIDNFNLRIYDL